MTIEKNIGIAISTFNAQEIIGNCLSKFKKHKFKIVIYDDLSTDNTLEIAKSIISDLVVINGNGSGWWAGGTAKAVDKCFSLGCDYVLMLNPDTVIYPEDLNYMVKFTSKNSKLITAGLVVRDSDKKKLFWVMFK